MSSTCNNKQTNKRVAIIGAGVVGITTAKCCLDEGLHIVVYERSDHTGGLWCHKPLEGQSQLDDGTATVMHSTITNSNKELSAFSDFPPLRKYPNFMHNTLMLEYIESYARKFDVNRHIRFRQEVQEASPQESKGTFKWNVTVRCLETGLVTTDVFDAVYVCTGHHGHKLMPDPIEGQDTFKGRIFHSHDVRSARGFEGQRVVIVGLGNSGGDLASELSPIARQVYVAMRRGTWIVSRVGPWGLPMDHFFLRRFVAILLCILPYNLFCSVFEVMINFNFNHARYGLKPEHRILSQHITVNDALPNWITSGRVILRSQIKRFTPTGVVFADSPDDIVTEVDAVIFATGYKVRYPFLPSSIVKIERNRLPLYKFVFPPNLPVAHAHTLAFLGLVQPLGPIMPMAELQARWAARLLAGRAKPLPPEEEMRKDIERKYKEMERFYTSERHTVSFDWIPYMDEIAQANDCRPPLFRYFFTDFRLWWHLMFGCAAAYQYRLVGPGAWKDARQTILDLNDRIERVWEPRPNDGCKLECAKSRGLGNLWFVLTFMLIVSLVCYSLV